MPLSGRVPPAGVHEDPAKTVTSEGSCESTRSYKKEKEKIRHRKQIYFESGVREDILKWNIDENENEKEKFRTEKKIDLHLAC